MKEVPEEIFTRLQKLLKSEASFRKSGSVAEAEAFAAKALELMAEYNLSKSDISLEDKPKMGDVTMDYQDIFPKNEGTWIKDLYHTISYYNYCRAINFVQDLSDIHRDEYDAMNKAAKKESKQGVSYKARMAFKERFFTKDWDFKQIVTIRLIGEEHNVEMTKYIIDQLINKAKPLARAAWKGYDKASWHELGLEDEWAPKEKRGQYLRGFLSGFVTGISVKLSATKKKMETDKPQIATMALTLRNQVEDYYKVKFKDAGKTHKGGGNKSEHGNNKGFEKGLETQINKGLGTNELNQKLLN